ncbi:hypothetical protein RDWZM_000145 [Blomia tropicalis]|uniref:Uncharacterized protein n=1 Tax=Blomia tropicalis TaxID=40697 RepID=A0A9Q0MD43_BLOTA|nr:hypothetical protein RDWZM_000145 [Blomia tropicalis]
MEGNFVTVKDDRIVAMFEDLESKGYVIVKECERDNNDSEYFRATIDVSELGVFTVGAHDRMSDAIRGVTLKLKIFLKKEGNGNSVSKHSLWEIKNRSDSPPMKTNSSQTKPITIGFVPLIERPKKTYTGSICSYDQSISEDNSSSSGFFQKPLIIFDDDPASPPTFSSTQLEPLISFDDDNLLNQITKTKKNKCFEEFVNKNYKNASFVLDEEHLQSQIDLIKKFNSVFSLSKSCFDVMEDLNKDGKIFSVETKRHDENENFSYQTTVQLSKMVSFIVPGENESCSKENAIRLTFNFLKSISDLIISFKEISSLTNDHTTIMRELLPKYRNLITINTKPCGDEFMTTAKLIGIHMFDEVASNPTNSINMAHERIINYFTKISSGTYEQTRGLNVLQGNLDSIPTEEKAFQEFIVDPKTRRYDSKTGIVNKSNTIHQALNIDKTHERVQLIKNFVSVYSKNKKSIEMLKELKSKYPAESQPLTFITQFDPIVCTYQTVIKIKPFGKVTANDLIEDECKRTAQRKAINFLKKMTEIVHYFKVAINNDEQKRSPLEIVEDLIRNNEVLIMLKTKHERSSHYETIIQFLNFTSISGIGSTSNESKEAAASNVLDYFKKYVLSFEPEMVEKMKMIKI